MPSSNLTVKSHAMLDMPADPAPFETYSADVSDLFGDLLKFNGKSGGWSAGVESKAIPAGTEVIAILGQMMVSFIRWSDGTPEQRFVPLASNPNLKEFRSTLGDLDPDKWEDETVGGMPKDPWQPAVLIPFVNPKTVAAYTFSTSSFGGVKASKQMIKGAVRQQRAAPDTTRNHLPLVALGESSYAHPNKTLGTIYTPVLDIVDWVPTADVAAVLKHGGFDALNVDLGAEPSEVEFE
jgi:hypothetical protein